MSGPRILSVEDDPQTIALYRRHYAEKGWPFHASQGCDLFAVLENFKPTVLLVDLRLNGKQGHELVRELRFLSRPGRTSCLRRRLKGPSTLDC